MGALHSSEGEDWASTTPGTLSAIDRIGQITARTQTNRVQKVLRGSKDKDEDKEEDKNKDKLIGFSIKCTTYARTEEGAIVPGEYKEEKVEVITEDGMLTVARADKVHLTVKWEGSETRNRWLDIRDRIMTHGAEFQTLTLEYESHFPGHGVFFSAFYGIPNPVEGLSVSLSGLSQERGVPAAVRFIDSFASADSLRELGIVGFGEQLAQLWLCDTPINLTGKKLVHVHLRFPDAMGSVFAGEWRRTGKTFWRTVMANDHIQKITAEVPRIDGAYWPVRWPARVKDRELDELIVHTREWDGKTPLVPFKRVRRLRLRGLPDAVAPWAALITDVLPSVTGEFRWTLTPSDDTSVVPWVQEQVTRLLQIFGELRTPPACAVHLDLNLHSTKLSDLMSMERFDWNIWWETLAREPVSTEDIQQYWRTTYQASDAVLRGITRTNFTITRSD